MDFQSRAQFSPGVVRDHNTDSSTYALTRISRYIFISPFSRVALHIPWSSTFCNEHVIGEEQTGLEVLLLEYELHPTSIISYSFLRLLDIRQVPADVGFTSQFNNAT